ncbi:MAG: PKD domain-containing protein [Chitinophagales bacterium]|nr:PKD domain-containing protein [Chitinophagales bacterium]
MKKIFTLFVLLFVVARFELAAQLQCGIQASFTYGCPPLVVNFFDQSTGGATGHFWDFDNNGVGNSTQQNPVYTFVNPGTYNVKHIITNGSQVDSCNIIIKVFMPPAANFTSPNPTGCILPCHNVSLINLATPGESPILEYVWDFGDGTLPVSLFPPQANTTHCYNQTGSFAVTLIVRDSNTCQSNFTIPGYVAIGNKPTITASAAPTQSCNSPTLVSFTSSGSSPNGGVSYQWFFGNGGNSTLQNPTQVYFNGIYDPYVVISDALGCKDSAFMHVEITKVDAGFTVANTNVCRNIPMQFTDTSNFAATWLWNFGDGTTSTQQNPLKTYTTNGTYTVTLTVSYNGCVDTETKTAYITVTDPVQFTFTANDTSDCYAPFTVNFTSVASGPAASYLWDFGDGNTSNQQNPIHTYTAEGSFTVSLSVANAAGCVNTKTYNNYINVHVIDAVFDLDSNNGCTPMTVTFTNSSTSNVPITSYQWFFGDGTSSSVANPVHVYNTAGQFIPYLIITNADGCKDTMFYPGVVNVGGGITPNFLAVPLIQCVNQTVAFSNLTVGADGTTKYFWEFGDGTTSTLINPVHEYSDTGYYDVKLTVIHQGCSVAIEKIKYILIVVPKAQFGFQFNCTNPTTVAFVDSSQGAHTWFWDFGDGTTSTQQNPTHTFPAQAPYVVTLVVTNNTTGCVDSMKKTLPIGTPQAKFSADTIAGCASFKVTFRDSSIFASSWLWLFGDGTSSNKQNPTKTYADTGKYTVTLIINPGQPCTDTLVKVQYITVYGVKAALEAIPPLGCSPLTVQFRDSSTSYMGSVVAWTWAFGTGDSSFIQHPTYTYSSNNPSANFIVRLTVRDSNGCSATRVFNGVKTYNPTANFVSDTIVCPGESVKFTNQSIGSNTYTWFFGDGTTSTQANPTHTYTAAGVYSVTLVARNTASGCTDTVTKMNYMYVDTPIADFFVTSDFAPCPPFPVQFYNASNRMDIQWLWYFGDGDTSTFKDPLHVYFYPGDYDVTLIAFDSSGCSDTMTKVAYIRVRGPYGVFTASQDSGCVPVTITITGSVFSTVTSVADMGDGVAFLDSLNVTYDYAEVGTFYPVYTLTDSLGCVVSYPVDTLVIGAIPYPDLPNDTTVCKGNYVQFNLPLGDSFVWTADQTPNYLSCTNCSNPVSTAPDTITYYVTATTNIGCTASDTIVVNVDALPIIFPGVSYRICPGDTLQLSAGPNVQAAVWTPNLFIDDTNLVSPKVWPPDTTIYRVTGTNQTGCSISRIVRINVIEKVVAELDFTDTLLCEGGAVQLSLNVLEASYLDTTFRWIPSAHLNNAFIEDPTFAAPHGTYSYIVITGGGHCIADTDQVTITVAPKPAVEAGDDKIVAVGTEVQLWAASPNPVTYSWTPAVDSFSCVNCRRPFVTVTTNQVVYAHAVNQWGCAASDSVVLKVVDCDPAAVFVPNVFTPNNDDLNDRLYVRGIGLNRLEYFRVFDRWGRLVFETKNINEGWDGTVNGVNADVATYAYVVKAYCSSNAIVEKSGNVTLVR